MREYLKITASGLIVALAVVPAFAQTGGRPQSEQQAPRDQGITRPGSTDSSGTTNQTPSQSGNQDSQTKSKMRDTPGTSTPGSGNTGSGMTRDNATGGTNMSGDNARGMRGDKAGQASVRQVQEALKAQGHDPGPIDGVMGPQTQEALRAYQRSQNLTETGRLDRETSQKLGVAGGTSQSQSR
jgi:hypothetical protein